MASISIVLVYFIRFPIFPLVVPFLEYDPADIPILFTALSFGTIEGLLLTLIVSIIQGVTVSSSSGIVGIIMHILSTGSFVLVAGLIYHRKKTTINAIVALTLGVITSAITMIAWNLIFTPHFMNVSIEVVIGILPFIIAFNLIKAGVN